jgi:hypothetical protein
VKLEGGQLPVQIGDCDPPVPEYGEEPTSFITRATTLRGPGNQSVAIEGGRVGHFDDAGLCYTWLGEPDERCPVELKANASTHVLGVLVVADGDEAATTYRQLGAPPKYTVTAYRGRYPFSNGQWPIQRPRKRASLVGGMATLGLGIGVVLGARGGSQDALFCASMALWPLVWFITFVYALDGFLEKPW